MSFPKYAEYKESGVEWLGDVPSHWDVCLAKRFLTVKSGDMISSDRETEEGTPIIGGNGIRGYTSESNTSADTLVIGRVGAQCGCVHHVLEDFWASEHAFCVKEKKPIINRFFYYLLSAINLNQFAIKTAQPLLNTTIVESQSISVPPPEEQRAIAAFLDRETSKIDALVAEQRRLIALLKEKRQAVISHAITKGLDPTVKLKDTGIEWLGQVPEHWEVGPLKRYWSVVDCKHITVPFYDEGYPVASVMEVRNFDVDLSQVQRTDKENYDLLRTGGRAPTKGDVIYCRNTANTGTSAFVNVDENICIGQDVVLLKAGERNGRFLNYVLHSQEMKMQLSRMMVGSTFRRINVAEIRRFTMTCPPTCEQDAVVGYLDERVSQFDRLIRDSEHTINILQERRSALVSAAVTGKFNVSQEKR